MHLNSQKIFEKYARPYFTDNMRILEIGPDKYPSTYCDVVGNRTLIWETLDLYHDPRLTYVAQSEYDFPLEDETFDIVLSGNVIEHVRKIWVWVKELARVCKAGGVVITINPVDWAYHEAPIDCWRIYPEGMRTLYAEARLDMKLCTFESLVPPEFSLSRRIKSYLRKMAGRPIGVLDTISIGIKSLV